LNDPMIGREIGNCTITAKLGQGGMAVVYQAHQPSLNREVAIKILTGPMALDEEFVTRFRREAMAAGALGHPNILTIFDAGTTDDGLHYMVMEYAPGGTLKALLDSGRLPVDRAREIAAQIADALQGAHAHGIVHRDLKPSNILFTRDGRPLLMDFGVALTSASTRLTRTGTAVGTPEYMSPEQAQGLAVDGRSDVYSLGIMLYEMLAGDVPFVGDTPLATLYQHVHNRVSAVHLIESGVPEWLSGVVLRALTKQPDDRHQTAGDLAAALRGERAVVPPPAPSEVAPPPPRAAAGPSAAVPAPKRRGGGALWALIAVVGIAVVVGVTYAVFFRTPGPSEWEPPTVGPTSIVLVTDTPQPGEDGSQAQTATAVAAVILTTEARETALAEGEAEGTRTAEGGTATAVAKTAEAGQNLAQRMTAEAPATQTAEVQAAETRAAQDTLSAATATAVAQAAQAAVAAEAAAATAFAVATEAAAATEVAGATATAQAQATATPEPATATALAAATYVAGLTATVQAQATGTAEAVVTPQITATPAPVSQAILSWRPESGQDDVFVRRGSQETNLTRHPARDYAAAWSANGQFVVFVSDRDGNPDIFSMNEDGGNPRNLTNGPAFDSAPAVSPDGNWIAFHSTRSGLYQIWVMRSDGSDLRHRVQSGQQDYSPQWSPDGSKIAFYRTVEADNYEIMVANSDGSNVQRLTFEPDWDYKPLWTPGGDQIVFKSRREGGDADRFYVVNLDGSNLRRLEGSINVLDKTHYPWTTRFSQ